MLISVILGVCLIPIAGKIVDVCNPKWVLPSGFFARAGALTAF
jgi:hypothetical protein